jgi:ubiquinone/menaquinone biosynthesis C-methylase UbiE
VAPSTGEVRRLRLAEQRRLPPRDTNLHRFWRDYLIGRDRTIGIELLTAGSAYRAMMELQIDALALGPGQHVADLGSGTGAFALQLAERADLPRDLRVSAIDYVHEAHQRARQRLADCPERAAIQLSQLEANLDLLHEGQGIPVADGVFDAAIASLLLSYLESPQRVLEEIHRVLRPGGRLVVSSLCRDADISRLYVESFAELQIGVTGRDLPELETGELGQVARSFLNDAARILELEDEGAFHFWDSEELRDLVSSAGFLEIDARKSLGRPPQAVVLSARKRA